MSITVREVYGPEPEHGILGYQIITEYESWDDWHFCNDCPGGKDRNPGFKNDWTFADYILENTGCI